VLLGPLRSRPTLRSNARCAARSGAFEGASIASDVERNLASLEGAP
jgi:hypothetical protein